MLTRDIGNLIGILFVRPSVGNVAVGLLQGLRHGFESGGGAIFLTPPHFLASGGGQNIA